MMKTWLCTLAEFAAVSLAAAEYFVAPSGKDNSEGTEKEPFRTIQKGVDTLKPGDVLTIFPGRYHESVKWKFDGSTELRTVVRAKIPGTVLLHGDRPVDGFQPVPGMRNCFVASWPEMPQSVQECDTLVKYARETGPAGSQVSFGTWRYDAAGKKLYISTSDGAAPDRHRITAAVLPSHGFGVESAKPNGMVTNVEVDGLSCRGFDTATPRPHQSVWGIYLERPADSVVRRSHAVLNAGGIGMSFADRCRIEDCTAVSNGTTHHVSAGNIIMLNSRNSVIDRCLSLRSRTNGIRFYGGGNANDRIARSVSLGDVRGSVRIKPCDELSLLSEVFTNGEAACNHTEYCVSASNDYDPTGKNSRTTQIMQKMNAVLCGRDFADPWNADLRLQNGSGIKCGFKGKNVYFIAPGGRDDQDGRSIDAPWKTLKNVQPGSTVYFLPGTYAGGLKLEADNVTLAGRGQYAPSVIQGGENGLTVTGSGITVLRLSFVGSRKNGLVCQGKNIVIDRCGFASCGNAVKADQVRDLSVIHSAFDRSVKNLIDAEKSSGTVRHSILPHANLPEGFAAAGNAYDTVPPASDAAGEQIEPQFTNAEKGDFSLKNESAFRCRALDGFHYGPYFVQYGAEHIVMPKPELLQAGRGMAVFGWWTPGKARNVFQIREKQKNWRQISDPTVDSVFHAAAVPGLKAGAEYEYQLVLQPAIQYKISSSYLPAPPRPKKTAKKKKTVTAPSAASEVQSFVMPAADRPVQTWHVSARSGSDSNSGSAEKPFRTIFRAAMATLPGDEVMVHEGVYSETVTAAASGLPGQPVVYRAAPGENVWLDGNGRRLSRGFVIFGKSHLKFDGFKFRQFGTAYPNTSGAVMILNGSDIEVTRCFHDGRGGGYAPPILNCRTGENITLRNSVAFSGMSQVTLVNAKNIVLENNVFLLASIWTVAAFLVPDGDLRFSRNIVSDNSRAKTFQGMLRLENLRSLKESDNLYYMRFPRELRVIADYQNDGKKRSGSWTKLTLDEYYRHIGSDGGSFFADPKLPALKLWQWKDAAERQRDQAQGVQFGVKANNQEFSRDPKNMSRFRSLDFRDCLVTPAPVGKDGKVIGLDPDQFKDMFTGSPQIRWEQR